MHRPRNLFLDTKPRISSPLALHVFTINQESSPPPTPSPRAISSATLRSPSPFHALDSSLQLPSPTSAFEITLRSVAQSALEEVYEKDVEGSITGEEATAVPAADEVQEEESGGQFKVDTSVQLMAAGTYTDAIEANDEGVVAIRGDSSRPSSNAVDALDTATKLIPATSLVIKTMGESNIKGPSTTSSPEGDLRANHPAYASESNTDTPEALTGSQGSMKPAKSFFANSHEPSVATSLQCGEKRRFHHRGVAERYVMERTEHKVDAEESDSPQRASPLQMASRAIAPLRARSMRERLQGVE